MVRINSITITNFQSHENTRLDFEKGLNVITGPSDQGKSAVIRAIKWVLYNEPRGTEFIRHGTSGAKVSIELSNGYTVIRERSKSKNRYTVLKPDGSEINLQGFGNEVPEEVIKAHRIPKVLLDNDKNSSLNIADQLEGPFLLSESGAVRAKAIGRLTGLHIIDRAIRGCIIDLRRENQNLDRLKKELEEIDKELKEYEDLESIAQRIRSSEHLIKRLEELVCRNSRLDTFKQKIGLLENEYSKVSSILSMTGGVQECGAIIRQLENIIDKNHRVAILAEKLNLLENEIAGTSDFLLKTGGIADGVDILTQINSKVERLKKLKYLKVMYEGIKSGIEDDYRYLEQNEHIIDNLIQQYAALLKDAGRCPLCNSKISDKRLEDIIKHYREVH